MAQKPLSTGVIVDVLVIFVFLSMVFTFSELGSNQRVTAYQTVALTTWLPESAAATSVNQRSSAIELCADHRYSGGWGI